MSTLAKPFTESDGAPTAAPVSDSLLAPATDGAPAQPRRLPLRRRR